MDDAGDVGVFVPPVGCVSADTSLGPADNPRAARASGSSPSFAEPIQVTANKESIVAISICLIARNLIPGVWTEF